MTVFWQIKIVYVLLLVSFALPSSASNERIAELKEAIHAYIEAKELGHKADTFLHARRAYNIGRKLYAKSPKNLAPIVFSYANAAAAYKEPIALEIFKKTLGIYAKAYGAKHTNLAPPLIEAAEEAIHRKEPEAAYSWLAKARELLNGEDFEDGFLRARLHMSLARLFLNSDQLSRAENHASQSIELATNSNPASTFTKEANLYFWHGQVTRKLGLYDLASNSYLKALSVFLKNEPRARQVLSIHLHMVEVSHQLSKTDQAIFHCIAAEKWENGRNRSMWWPIYDPSGRTTRGDTPKTGQILAGYVKAEDCRAHDIVIHKTIGISPEEAKIILQKVYVAPSLLRNSKNADQKVPQINIDVY